MADLTIVQETLIGAGVHRSTLPRVVVCRRPGHLSNTSHRRLHGLHNARHHLGTLFVCWKLRFLQQLGQGHCVFLLVFVIIAALSIIRCYHKIPTVPLSFLSRPLLSPTVGPPETSKGVCRSAVSSLSGVRDTVPAENEFGALYRVNIKK